MQKNKKVFTIILVLTIFLYSAMPVFATTYKYDSRGNLIEVVNNGGGVIKYMYDANNNVISTLTTQYPAQTFPTITTAAGKLTRGIVGVDYSVKISADNSPTSFTVTSGSLPEGLSISKKGVISGTPTSAGTYNFTLRASSELGSSVPVIYYIEIIDIKTATQQQSEEIAKKEGFPVSVIVDGKAADTATMVVKGEVATVAVDQTALQIQMAGAKSSVVIPVSTTGNTNTNVVIVQLPFKNLEEIANKGLTLTVQAGGLSYKIPAGAIDTASAERQFEIKEPDKALVNINIIKTVSNDTKKRAEVAITPRGGKIVAPMSQFSITVSNGGYYTFEINKFKKFMECSIEVTADQAKRITTAIAVRPNGSIHHAPTRIYQQGGKWYASINSSSNSAYALTCYDKSFSDAKGKWYETAVNEMANRNIISGVRSGQFVGDRSVTRAEFASIIVNALGIPATGKATMFKDVKSTAWYYSVVGTAHDYGLVNGRGNGKFDPNANITWQEAMAMIRNASRVVEYDGTPGSFATYTDASQVSKWAKEAVEFYIGSGLFVHGDKLRPTENITRAETAVAVLELLRKAKLVDEPS